MKNINNSTIAYLFYALGTIDYVSANYLNNDLTGIPFSPIILGAIGSIFMFLHNSKIKESNNKVYELFKFSLYAVLISDDIIDDSELEYSASILNTLENELLLPTNPTKLEQEIKNYELNEIYEKIKILESSVPYQTKLDILSSCAILCVMDGQIDEIEQESIYKISNILNISNNDMKNIFNTSIASYIDFENSDRQKLQINDSEVKKVVEEKKAENKSNKNQIYAGIGIFAVIVIFGIYSSFQVTIEESCENFVENYETKIIEISNQSVTTTNIMVNTVNEFLETVNTTTYRSYTYEEQVNFHNELFSNFYISIESLEKDLEALNSINFNYSNEHDDLQKVGDLFELYLDKTKEIKTEDLKYYYTFLQKIDLYEKFYYDWDQSNNNNERERITEDFDKNNSELNSNLTQIDSYILNLINEKDILRENYIEYVAIVCTAYSWDD